MSAIQRAKKDKYVGIVIHANAMLFSNGITQNAYFIYQCLTHCGFKCKFLCNEEVTQPFAHKGIPVKQMSTNPALFDASIFHTIISATRNVPADMKPIFKKHRTRIIAFVCGNHYMQDNENFVNGSKDTTFHGRDTVSDELWIIPSLEFSLEYFKTLRMVPVRIVPHLWSSSLLNERALQLSKKTERELIYDVVKHSGKKIEIVIMEPNIGLVKTGWLPLIASERLFQDHPDLVEFVFVFNYPKHDSSWKMTDHLTLGKKLRRFKRLEIDQIFSHFNTQETIPIFVCHQFNNTLNYLYYELLHYGYPLVHNSPEVGNCGYFYPQNNIMKCVESIMDAYKNHNTNIEVYRQNAEACLSKINPESAIMGKSWTQLIDAGLEAELGNNPVK